MKSPISKETIDGVLAKMDISDISNATIRQCVAVANKLEELENMRFIHLEIGVPGILACPVGIEAQQHCARISPYRRYSCAEAERFQVPQGLC